ncbi:DUF2459 domain-containing protein [Marinigracilibium pacificum]|uniref:DUF2459 domain-containing protein n=1 Tax=Marinigracilibium pacificum TaxID=2729599 RepID=A0A848IUA2_9BACT|nr:DUF2459 domain-containing protein [Marinigracilibium pacificum]NMM47917.1 DUF2459 domain-containing protein [Marinigracilibium pacificum]
MKFFKHFVKWVLFFLTLPIIYLAVSLLLTSITVERESTNEPANKTIYLSTNGVHLDIVIPQEDIDSLLLSGIKHGQFADYISFGWGDENFYINTPTWDDLTFGNAFSAMFLKSSTLMHVTRYKGKRSGWVGVKITEDELRKINSYIQESFKLDDNGQKTILENQGYSTIDDFYKAKGSYSCYKTCNSWVNIGFKESGLKSCLWTPFDFGLMNKYK